MGKRKEFQGEVVSNKMKKTIVVRVEHHTKHPKYGRIMKGYKKYKVHDETNIANMGDVVRIQETRPLSKEKRFRLKDIVRKAAIGNVEVKEEVVI
ncbi:MAG: 30S ribosomal protein S17 [Candidatus Omnitrophota bacterium]|jgi:small subunit ribosomal protein S17